MIHIHSLTVQRPEMLAAAMAAIVLAAVVARWRRILLPRAAMTLMLLGMIAVALAMAQLTWRRPGTGSVAVMVDLSPSTRGALFRQTSFLKQRIRQLLGDQPFNLYGFAQTTAPIDLGAAPAELAEMTAERTLFSPPAAAAVVLFSDGNFDLPSAAPPTFVVIDAALENPADAAVRRLEIRGGQLLATLDITADRRNVTLRGVSGPATRSVATGTTVVTAPLDARSGSAAAEVEHRDLWPENDELTIPLAPPALSQRWWIGTAPAAGPWRALDPGQLPDDAGEYLAAAVIVLDDVPAAELSATARLRLEQYVRDLGGTLLILGGPHSFAAGAYAGTQLETLSPLSSHPPRPTTLWMLLADSSGSMADEISPGQSKWSAVSSAMVSVLATLPGDDPVQVGQFSDVLRWWPVGKNARQTALLRLPPADALPSGPTNLEMALNQIADQSAGDLPVQLLLLSDCDTTIEHPAELAAKLKSRHIHLHVLAIERGSAMETIGRMCQVTGGRLEQQLDVLHWAEAAQQMIQAAQPGGVETQPMPLRFIDAARSLGSATAPVWNRTWLKRDATRIAEPADVGLDGDGTALGGLWQFGAGRVAALAFAPDQQAPWANAADLAILLASPPRDPRFAVAWDAGSKLSVRVDAIDGRQFLNGLAMELEIADADLSAPGQSQPVPQAEPGRYVLAMEAPTRPAIATLRSGGRVIDRIAVAGRYPPEFDRIGNDRQAMRRLADLSGGGVIDVRQTTPIHFDFPPRPHELSPWLNAVGCVLLLASLLVWRRGSRRA